MEISKTRTYYWNFDIVLLWLPFIFYGLQLCTSPANRELSISILRFIKASIWYQGSDLPVRFAITGARNTACVPWVSPDLTAIDPGLHASIQRRLLTLVQEASTAHVRSARRYSAQKPALDSSLTTMCIVA